MTLKQNLFFAGCFLICLAGLFAWLFAWQYITAQAYPHGAPPEPRIPRVVQLIFGAALLYAALQVGLWLRSNRSRTN